MNENYRSIPIHPEWTTDIMMYITSNNNRPLTDYPLFQEGRMMAKLITYEEYKQTTKQWRFDVRYPDMNDPLKIIEIDTDKWWSIRVTFADNNNGRVAQNMEDAGVFDLEKHFYAVPRIWSSFPAVNILSKAHINRIITFDLVAREDMFRGPERWFELRQPALSLQSDIEYCIRKIPILSECIGYVQDYDFDKDERTKELMYNGRMGMELYPLDGKNDSEIRPAQYQSIDPKNVICTLLEIDKEENKVIVRISKDNAERLSRITGSKHPYARPRGFVSEGQFGKKLEKFITFDIIMR